MMQAPKRCDKRLSITRFTADLHLSRVSTNGKFVVHCVTEVELVFTLGAFHEAGVVAGDRIEHTSVAPDPLVTAIAEAGLQVGSQPHFVPSEAISIAPAFRRAIGRTSTAYVRSALRAWCLRQVAMRRSDVPAPGRQWLPQFLAALRAGIVWGPTRR